MINSIEVLLRQRRRDEVLYLLNLALNIPCASRDKQIQQLVLERLFFVNLIDENIGKKVWKRKLRSCPQMLNKQCLKYQGVSDPIQKFFKKVILQQKTWRELIVEYSWNNTVFHIERYQSWTLYEWWLIFLCISVCSGSRAILLCLSIIRRNPNALKAASTYINFNKFQDKLNKLLKKDIIQLNLIHYKIERNLLISLKLNEDFDQIANRLNLQQILQSSLDPLFGERQSWTIYLCSKFSDNKQKEYYKINDKQRKIQWVSSRQCFQHLFQKFSLIINNFICFQQYFTNELEVILLYNLSRKRKWLQTRLQIQQFFDSYIKNNLFGVKQIRLFRKNYKFIRTYRQTYRNLLTIRLINSNNNINEANIDRKQIEIQSLVHQDKCSQIQMIMYERNQQQIQELVTLSMAIRCKSEDQQIRQMVLSRFLMIETDILCSLKNRSLNFLKYNKINYVNLKIQKVIDPFYSLLMKAFLSGQSWNDLILNNKWKYICYSTGEFSYYEDWILFLCFQKFNIKKQRMCLSLCLSQRQIKEIIEKQSQLNCSHYVKKLQIWLNKDIDELNLIAYEIERNLLISLKLKESFSETILRLQLEQKLNSTINLFQNKRSNWIRFLCLTFTDNNINDWPNFDINQQKIKWVKMNYDYKSYQMKQHVKNYAMNKKILEKYIEKYQPYFQRCFTDEIEEILLYQIWHRNKWQQAKMVLQNCCNKTTSVIVEIDCKQKKVIDEINRSDSRIQLYQQLNYLHNHYTNKGKQKKSIFYLQTTGKFPNQQFQEIVIDDGDISQSSILSLCINDREKVEPINQNNNLKDQYLTNQISDIGRNPLMDLMLITNIQNRKHSSISQGAQFFDFEIKHIANSFVLGFARLVSNIQSREISSNQIMK